MTGSTRTVAMDPERTITLDAGWRATTCIDHDGNESLWLVSPTPQLLSGCACRACAPHDQLTGDRADRRTPA